MDLSNPVMDDVFANSSLSDPPPTPPSPLLYAFLILLPVEAVVANALLICVLLRDRRFQKSVSAKYFVLSLSVSDLLVSLIIMPFGVVSLVRNQWVFGSFWCELWQTLDYFACTASIFNLCAISSDRYLAISQPIRYSLHFGKKRLLVVIFSVWGAAALITFPPMIAHQLGLFTLCETDRCPNCATLFFEPSYVVFSAVSSFFIPSLLMLTVNYRTHAIARQQIAAYRHGAKCTASGQPLLRINVPGRSTYTPAALHATGSDSTSTMGGSTKENGRSDSDGGHAHLGQQTSSQSNCSAGQAAHHFTLLSTEYKATKTLGLVMGVFFVCWLPYYVIFVVVAFCSHCLPKDELVSAWTLWLGWANSGMNPIIYGCLSKKIRRQLRQLLTGSR